MSHFRLFLPVFRGQKDEPVCVGKQTLPLTRAPVPSLTNFYLEIGPDELVGLPPLHKFDR